LHNNPAAKLESFDALAVDVFIVSLPYLLIFTLEPSTPRTIPLRLHRARSVDPTNRELVEICAAQRTFEGAYICTLLSRFSIALVVLKIFISEFYSIGALFAVYGAGVLVASAYRRQ
jgi:hypothetical protein